MDNIAVWFMLTEIGMQNDGMFGILCWMYMSQQWTGYDEESRRKKIWRRCRQQDTRTAGGRWRWQHRTELKMDRNGLCSTGSNKA